MTLLHFIVVTYIRKCGEVAATDSKLPVPEPGDIKKAATVMFDDIEAELNSFDLKLNGNNLTSSFPCLCSYNCKTKIKDLNFIFDNAC